MFYDNLKTICDLQGLKITKLVTECGGSLGSINQWKKGANPNSGIVVELALRLGVTTDYLLMGKEHAEIYSHISNSQVGAIKNDGTITVNAPVNGESDFLTQFLEAFNALSLTDKVEVINFTLEKIKKQ